MPLPMVHLAISVRMRAQDGRALTPDFLLGSIAPDAIHMRPNAAPWASVAPTIAFRGQRPWVVLGSPGSERITPSILQVLLRLQTHPPLAAVDAPRLFCSLDGLVSLEASRMRDDVPEALQAAGFEIQRRDPYSFYLGCVQLVMRDGDELVGVADARRDGSAAGPPR